MSDNVADTEEYRGCTIEILYDMSGGGSPREWDNLTTFVFAKHRCYNMPNEVDFDFDGYNEWKHEWETIRSRYTKETAPSYAEWCVTTLKEQHGALFVRPVYMIDHSGVAYRMGDSEDSGNPFHDPWDSGQIGYIIITPKGVEMCGTPPELFEQVARQDVEQYGMWANGEVYGWAALDPYGETIESCWGYIGHDEWDYMKSEARSAIDGYFDSREQQAADIMADSIAALKIG